MEPDELELLNEVWPQLEAYKLGPGHNGDQLVCECMCISLSMIREVLKGKEVNLSALSEKLGLGSGCSKCIKSFPEWKDKI